MPRRFHDEAAGREDEGDGGRTASESKRDNNGELKRTSVVQGEGEREGDR